MLTGVLRVKDHAGRYGGEEFLLILSGDGVTDPHPDSFLVRLRLAWEASRPHPVTFSAALESMMTSWPWMRDLTADQLARTREDLDSTVRFIAAARLVEDPGILMEFLDWLRSPLGARGVPAASLVAGLEALAPLVVDVDPLAGPLIRDGLSHVCDSSTDT